MENVSTEIRYVVTEQLEARKFAAKKYDWWDCPGICESCTYGDVEIGVRNRRLAERVCDITFETYKGFCPEIGETFGQELCYFAHNVCEFLGTIKETGRAIIWREPFVSCFNEDKWSYQDVPFSIDELSDIVCKMKNTSTERIVVDQSV